MENGCFCNVPDGTGTSFPDNQKDKATTPQKFNYKPKQSVFDWYMNTQSEHKALLS